MNKKLMWIILAIIALTAFIYEGNKIKSQSLIPQCFEKEDCRVSVRQGYCSVKYDCIQGKCYSSNALCPETCNSGIDDDKDGKIDCDDTDCWNNPLCSCMNVDFNECAYGRCWCYGGTRPRWYISGEGNYCACV